MSAITVSGLGTGDLPMASVTDPAANAAVATAIIDKYSGVIVTLTAAGNSQILQNPTSLTAGKRFTVVSTDGNGVHTIEVNGITLSAGEAQRFIWGGSAWVAVTAVDADDIAFTPVGDVVATNVQSMGEELDAEKMKRIASVDNEIARFNGVGGDVQGYSSNAPVISDGGLGNFPGGLKTVDPIDEHGVGDRGFNDSRYGATVYNDVGRPGEMDFGVGLCPADVLALISGMASMSGCIQSGHANHGNYQYLDGSVMCWLPRCYYKVGTGSNGLAVNLFDVKSIYDYPDTEIAITGLTRANPCVASVTAHGRSNGDYIWISHITSQAEWKSLSGKVYKVKNKTDDTFELTDTSDANIDTSGYAAAFVPASDPSAKTIYNEAMANGYAWFRADIDGGKIQAGQFVDKYMSSKNAKGAGHIASSIKNGLPISTAAAHNPIADLTACSSNNYYQVINAAHARDGVGGAINSDSIFFSISRFIQAKLAILSRAHGDASSNIANCAWYHATYNYPKGCNNDALRDADDTTVLYESDGYSNCGKVGSGALFAKTTHNGQDSGVADVNGLMWEINLGATCIAAVAAIEAITSAATPVFTWTGHGLSVGKYVMILAITQADWVNFKDKMWKVATVPDGNTFTLETAPDASGYAAYDAGTDPGTFTKGTWYAAKPETAMKDFTPGNSGATDHWGAAGVAAMMEEFTPAFETVYSGNGFGQRFGSGSNQVLSEAEFEAAWLLSGFGFPKDKDGVDTVGTNQFGKDYYYQYIRNELCLRSCGPWDDGAPAGVWHVAWYDDRADSSRGTGLRAACCPE